MNDRILVHKQSILHITLQLLGKYAEPKL